MITRDTITRIMDAVRIEEVVGDFITLKRRGANMLGNCPFHNEKTPSFTVSPAKGIYKCFGCGVAGDSVKFIIEHEHKTYPEALRYLAEKYAIEIEESEAPSDKQIEEKNERDSLYIVSAFAQRFYSEQLLDTEEGQNVGLTYFKERGFTKETIERFQLGYSPEKGDALVKASEAQGYLVEYLQKAGLASDKYDKPYDFFRGRVMFTIHNFMGKVVGFGGRTLLSDKKVPKYVNTPETDIYNKSRILYGLFQAKNAVRKEDECILVEGYTDVISLSQAGVENVVASSGTSLTVEQVRLIKRLTPNITVTYDGDAAGIKAAIRGIDLILEEDMNVRVVLLPPDDDPDSFVKREGADGFIRYRNNHIQDFILFKASFLQEESKKDPVKRAEAIKDIVDSIALIPDAIKRSVYVKECSQLLDMQEQILVSEVNKIRHQKNSKKAGSHPEDSPRYVNEEIPDLKEPALPASINALARQERDVVRLLLEYAKLDFDEEWKVAHAILMELDGDDTPMVDSVSEKIINIYRTSIQEESLIPETQQFLSNEDPEISSFAIEILQKPYELSDNWIKMHDIAITDTHFVYKKDIHSSLYRLKLERLKILIDESRNGMQKAQDEGDEMALIEQVQLYQHYIELKKQIAAALGSVILPG
jgi:DNA primase